MLIRRATTTDLPRIREIYNQAVLERSATCDEEPKTLEERTSWFAQFDDRYPIFVGEEAGAVVGYACLFRYSPKSGYRFTVENSVYIDAAARGKGLGRALLIHLIEVTRSLGYKYIEAKIFRHNPASIELHRSLGFKLVGVHERIANLGGRWFDTTIHALSLHQDGPG